MFLKAVVKLLFFFGLLCQTTQAQATNTLLPAPKGWWVRWITPDLYTAGRLTEDQIKYASETGFNSIISLFNFTVPDSIGEDNLPTTDKAKDIATRLAGLQFYQVLQPGESGFTIEAVLRFGEHFQAALKPVLFHCGSAYSASFVALSYLANVSRHDPSAIPRIDINEFFRRAALLGYDYTSNEQAREVIQSITGEAIPVNVTKPDTSLTTWRRLWLIKPVIKNWFIAGQIQSNYLVMLQETGIKSVVNVRQGVTFEGSPSQEEVILLNIHDSTGTYEEGGRQSQARLEATRIDPNKTNEYINVNSTRNYASRNSLPFGDDVGYNETIERTALNDVEGVTYIHTPIGGQLRYSVQMWERHKDKILNAGKIGAVLVHCGSATRASVYGLLGSGVQHGKNSEWAIQRAAELGIRYPDNHREAVFNLFRRVLDGSSGASKMTVTIVTMTVCYLTSIIFM